MNSKKKNLNSEIILIFNPNPKAHIIWFLPFFFHVIPISLTFSFFLFLSTNFHKSHIWVEPNNSFFCY